jgi:hypothetical protein
MFDVFGPLKSAMKLSEVSIDNNVFRLHYKATVIFLVAFSLLVTSRQYFGDPISCIQRDDIPNNVINTYCWIHATFTLPAAFDKRIGVEVPHPGVDKYHPGEQRVYHKYYQWVCFLLFLQAITFYVPHYLWKLWEGGRMKALVNGLSGPIQKKQERGDQIAIVADYMRNHFGHHNSYFFYFVFCEVLNFLNVIAQVYLIDAFLGGSFRTYGLDVLRFTEMDQSKRIDPMVKVFPRMTKCTFHRFGSSGDVQRHDALCILPLNIINEKIYVFLWFWMLGLGIVSFLILLYRAVTIFCPNFRFVLLTTRVRVTRGFKVRSVLDNGEVGDWFLLYLLSKNLDVFNFKALIEELHKSTESLDDSTDDKKNDPSQELLSEKV